MSSTIRIKRSSVRGKVPNTSNISTGELALNLVDKRLYSSNGTATFEIGSNPHSLTVGSGTFSFANGALTLPTADGTSGQVIRTDGAGNLSFATVSGGGGSFEASLQPIKLDSITTNGNTAYSLVSSGSAYTPSQQNGLLVSINGVIQEPGVGFTVSGSTITFGQALAADDVVDFIVDYTSTGTLSLSNNSIQFINVTSTKTQTVGTGDNSSTKYILLGTTTSNTETEILTTDSARIAVSSNSTVFYQVSFAARRTDATGESASWHLKGCVDNFSGTVADVGDVYEIAVAQDDVTWSVDVRADDTNDAIGVFVRGATGKTVKWTALVETVEVKQ